ncbi:hypothetical protein [Companilactobacillus mishanensis]|nr:hypothetical protein [Companilactobacillus mishanensis]
MKKLIDTEHVQLTIERVEPKLSVLFVYLILIGGLALLSLFKVR